MRIGDIVLYRTGLDDVVPAVVTRIWPNDVLNLTVFLDEYASYIHMPAAVVRRTSVSHGDGIGHWQPREYTDQVCDVCL